MDTESSNLHFQKILSNIKHLLGLSNVDDSQIDPETMKQIAEAARNVAAASSDLHAKYGDGHDITMSENLMRSEAHKITLKKSTKDYKNMLGDITQHKEVFETAKKMPNSNWGSWAIRNYKQDPEKFKEAKPHLEHYAGSQHIPEIAKVRFDKTHDFDSGLNQLKTAEKQYNDRIKNNTNVLVPSKKTKKILDVGNGRAWYSLGRGSCGIEGKAMGHCGNVPSEQENHDILSLRTSHNIGGIEHHEPHLTFINDKNSNFIGEMKGRGNEKPAKHHHQAIAKLLEQGYVPHGGGYLQENNFHIDDLSPELQQRVFNKNPSAFLHSDDSEKRNTAIDNALKTNSIPTYVRRRLAENPNLDPKHHGILAADEDGFVRLALAKNPNLDPKHHGKLAADED